jgi:predicted nucleotidyltransferase component of viral defense system
MSKDAMSLKAQLRNLSKKKNVMAQILLQNYMFERFLERLSLSEYKEKFILKGGMLISAIVGIDTRTTMDLDATIRGLSFSEENILKTISDICSLQIDDGVVLTVGGVTPIRADDKYGGFRTKVTAVYDTIETPFSIDISTGDVITPNPVKFIFRGMFDDKKQIELWAYNIETVISEKLETVLRRGSLNTRPRDFYDIYVLYTTQSYDVSLLKEAYTATVLHRNTAEQVSDTDAILKHIDNSAELRQQWDKYRREFAYATDLSYDDIIKSLTAICEKLS